MTQVEILRKNLIEELNHIDDEELLLKLKTFLSQASKAEEIYELSEDQIQQLKESEAQIKSGDAKDHPTVIAEAREWLNQK